MMLAYRCCDSRLLTWGAIPGGKGAVALTVSSNVRCWIDVETLEKPTSDGFANLI